MAGETYVDRLTQTMWVYDSEKEEMALRPVTYVPGLYMMLDEILINAADNKQLNPKMNSLKVSIDVESNCITVFNNGGRIPLEIYQEERVYWAKLFSTDFVVETWDGVNLSKQFLKGTRSEPTVSKCRASEKWTKITFKPDLAKFGMTYLEEDVVALMKKRVIDVAGCLGKTVKVELNDKMYQFKSFSDYCQLYLKSIACGSEPLPRFEHVHDSWQVCVSRSNGLFEQVSFVNGIATHKGGTHVDYIANKIAIRLATMVNTITKNKSIEVKPHNVKNHLWVFVNARIDNPTFETQTKETLTLPAKCFGSSWDFTPKFLDKVAKSEIMKNIQEWVLKKTDISVRKTAIIDGHHPALEWGKQESHLCTLILTQGDSAKSLAIAGRTFIGKRHYGVFPLTGQLPKVTEVNRTQMMHNVELTKIKQILGLQHGVNYDDAKSLKYGHVMIMTDQDHNGSQIKGLLINLLHSFWPSLLKVPYFLLEFVTPIVKAKHKDGIRIEAFYTMPKYESWKKRVGIEVDNWSIKYYKGLGTSTDEEVMEYFLELAKHRKYFVWGGLEDKEAIQIAFSGKMIEDRKSWLLQYDPGSFLDDADKHITYQDFVHKELILFSIADVRRSIPSMVDGFKPGQRKILFCSFKRNFVEEAKVEDFCGYVCENGNHGEKKLAGTIIAMAQDYVGSNNINLLLPIGQFGTRLQGGKDHASPKHIYTQLAPITRFLFPKADDILLNYLEEDGKSVEPTWYMPIIPMVLVNGCEGIGTGWSTYVPNYNPFDIIENIRRLMKGERMKEMRPWYKGFIGSIEKNEKDQGSYTVTGNLQELDEKTMRISELPIQKWTQDYKEFLESVSIDNDKSTDPFIEEFCDNSAGDIVDFSICMAEERLPAVEQEGLLKKLKLSTSISTTNMHLFNSQGRIKKYETPKQILEEFYYLRLEFYEKRKKTLLSILKKEMLKCENKCRFIKGVIDGSISISNREKADLLLELKAKGFTPFPTKETTSNVSVGGVGNDYDYLLTLPLETQCRGKMDEVIGERHELFGNIDDLEQTSAKCLWERDLDALEGRLDRERVKYVKKMESDRKRIHDGAYGKGRVAQVKKELRGKAAAKSAAPVVAARPKRAKKIGQLKKQHRGRPKPVAQLSTPVARPKRANRVQPKYFMTDSDSSSSSTTNDDYSDYSCSD